MKTGMSRFTKGCLMTALVTFIIGCLLCGVGALLGGFRGLITSNIEGITGIPFRVYQYDDGGIEFGFMNDRWDNDIDWSGYEKWNRVDNNAGEIELDLTADTLRELRLELGACELQIKESENDKVSFKVSGEAKYFRYLVENDGTLRMTHRWGSGIWNWSNHMITTATKVYLYLPEGTAPDYVDIDIGAGSMEAVGLQAREVDIEVGAGMCNVAHLTAAQETDLLIGAGRITLGTLETEELNMNVGAGELRIEDARVQRGADLQIGMGNADLRGLFQGDMNVDCGMGNVTMNLDDAETDHNYEIECSMGNVRLDRRSYTGMSEEVSIDNGSSSTYELECSMGNITVNFAK